MIVFGCHCRRGSAGTGRDEEKRERLSEGRWGEGDDGQEEGAEEEEDEAEVSPIWPSHQPKMVKFMYFQAELFKKLTKR